MVTKLYAAITKKEQLRLVCSSGGYITTGAYKFIELGGVVYAAAMFEDYHIEHIRVDNFIDLEKTAGSKYSVSSLKNALPHMESDLIQGKRVLFIGTPCQCESMKKRFVEYDNLFLIDLICHGNTTSRYYEAYLDYLESQFGPFSQFKFRDKSVYGLSAVSSIVLPDGRKKVLYSPKYNWYYYYMKQDAYLDSCYTCAYTNLNRVGDITVGDFWGLEIIDPEFSTQSGVSAVLVSSQKGRELWNNTKDTVTYKEEDLTKYIPHNAALEHTVCRGAHYDAVQKYLKSDNAVYIFSHVYTITTIEKIVGFVKRIIPMKIYKKIIKYKRRKECS